MQTPQLVHDARSAVVAKRDRLIRLPETLRLVGLGHSTWYALMARGEAPQSVKVTPRCVAWSENAVLTFVQARLDAANQPTQPRAQTSAGTAESTNEGAQ